MDFGPARSIRSRLALLSVALTLCVWTETLRADWFGYAKADGSVFDESSDGKKEDHDSMNVTSLAVGAGVVVRTAGSTGSFYGHASVDIHSTENPRDPTRSSQTLLLHGDIRTQNASPVDTEGGPPSVLATAVWFDTLHLTNTDVLDYTALGALHLRFYPTLRGSISGDGAYADLSVTIGSELVGDLESHANATEPGNFSETLKFDIPAPATAGPPGFTLRMTLEVGGISFEDGGASVADFDHTADLGTIYVCDADGNPIPNADKLQLVGDSGMVYDLRSIPEPSTWVCLALAGVGVIGCVVRRRTLA